MLTQDFEAAIDRRFGAANAKGLREIEINSGDLHRQVGGYPGPNHRMPACCQAMWNKKRSGDVVVSAPPKLKGASLTIRYHLPR